VRLSLGPTRDVVVVDGTAEPVDIADLASKTGDAFATKTGFDPRELVEPYQYFLIRPRRTRPGVRRTSCGDATTAAGSADRRTGTHPPHPASGAAEDVDFQRDSSLRSNRADASQTAPAPTFVGRRT
jgi:hypothetical protein